MPRLNLSTILYVPENTALGSSIYKVRTTDNDGDALTYNMTSSPGTEMTYFSIDRSSGIIITSTVRAINYEEINNMILTFNVSVYDGKLTVYKDLKIRVSSVNEGLSLSQPVYRIVANESLAGIQHPDPGLLVNDTDSGDTHSFTHDCSANTGYFTMNPFNGILTFAVDYDLDVPGKPKMITCIVTVTDRADEINDNTPMFKYTPYKFYAYNDSGVGLVLGSISATDADIGINGQFSYYINRTGSSHKYFNVSSNGHVKLQRSLNGTAERTNLIFTVYATDDGSPSLTGFATVTVTVLEGSVATASTTTIGFRTFIQDERNIVWITFLSLLALLTTLLTAWVCWRTNRNWPTGFDPFEKCARNCRRPKWCRDYNNNSGKGSSRTRPVFMKSNQPKPEKPKKQPSMTPQISPGNTLPNISSTVIHSPKRPEVTRSPIRPKASHSPIRPEATHSQIGPKDDPNFRVNDFLTERWH